MAILSILLSALLSLAPTVLILVGQCHVNKKAGRPGWHAIIPYLCQYTRANIGGNTKNFWVMLISSMASGVFTVVGWIINKYFPDASTIALICTLTSLPASLITIIMFVKIQNGISHVFGHGVGFTLGLIFIPLVFYPILAFGKSEYQGETPEVPIKEKKIKEPKKTKAAKEKKEKTPKVSKTKNKKKEKQQDLDNNQAVNDNVEDEDSSQKFMTMDEMMLKSLSAARKPIPVQAPPKPAYEPEPAPEVPPKQQNRFTIPVEYVPQSQEPPVIPTDYLIPAFARPDYKPAPPLKTEPSILKEKTIVETASQLLSDNNAIYAPQHETPVPPPQSKTRETNPFSFFEQPPAGAPCPKQESFTPAENSFTEQPNDRQKVAQQFMFEPAAPEFNPHVQNEGIAQTQKDEKQASSTSHQNPSSIFGFESFGAPQDTPVELPVLKKEETEIQTTDEAALENSSETEKKYEEPVTDTTPTAEASIQEESAPIEEKKAPLRFIDPKPAEEKKVEEDDDNLPPPPVVSLPPKRGLFSRKPKTIDRFHNEDGGLK